MPIQKPLETKLAADMTVIATASRLLDLNKMEEAGVLIGRAIQGGLCSPHLDFQIGRLLEKSGELSRAIEYYRLAAREGDGLPGAWGALARALRRSGLIREAIGADCAADGTGFSAGRRNKRPVCGRCRPSETRIHHRSPRLRRSGFIPIVLKIEAVERRQGWGRCAIPPKPPGDFRSQGLAFMTPGGLGGPARSTQLFPGSMIPRAWRRRPQPARGDVFARPGPHPYPQSHRRHRCLVRRDRPRAGAP
jgi:hypothetical protein